MHRRSVLVAALVAAFFAGAGLAAQQAPPRFVERVDVARTLVDARVLDDRGNPVTGLTADDFKLTVDGTTARVESATWIGGHDADVDLAHLTSATPAPPPNASAPPRQGRLIVYLFQKDFESSRLRGLMKMLLKSRAVLNTITPDDRIAILSFDSYLKIWTDFTSDRPRLDRILAHDLLLGAPPQSVPASPGASLVERLDRDRGKRTYGIERALELIGNALEPLPGSKSLVLFGYGFGQLGLSGMQMENGYAAARQALVTSRTSVFSLDVTDADYHSLEAGLQIVSEQTGGFYAKTNLFPDLAMRRLAGALSGYYVLIIEKPDNTRAVHDIKAELTRRKGNVFISTNLADHDR